MESLCRKIGTFMFFGSSFRMNFATATKNAPKKGGAQKKDVKPSKQKLMKRQKIAASNQVSAARKNGHSDRSVPYSRALFTVENKSDELIKSEESLRRELIAKSWSRWNMLKLHKETEFEVNYVRSRLRAMNELQAVSPVLAELASEISYKPAPITIKPAAETKPEKMAFE
jgi:hypothetical protein